MSKQNDRVAVVTGAARGIGAATMRRLAADGAIVVGLDLDGDAAESVAVSMGKGAGYACDITDRAQVADAVQAIAERFGRIDVLVNNAAYQMVQPGGIADITTEQLDRVMKTNLYAMFWLCKKALPHMPKGSAIINTSSVQASSPSPELLDYATTKAGIVNFTRGLALSVAEKGIRVNSVAPGPIWTPLIPATMPEDKVGTFGEDTPLGRAGQPAELAPAYVFLASPESSYITGEVIAVTGGQPVSV
jgi:NAD(P)-dependent dehydrogenase (short-subunit alcohol dehydrogenase family)